MSALVGVSLPEIGEASKVGRSLGGVGRGLLLVKLRNARPLSREWDEFRDDVRVAIKLRRLAAPQRFSISLQ